MSRNKLLQSSWCRSQIKEVMMDWTCSLHVVKIFTVNEIGCYMELREIETDIVR